MPLSNPITINIPSSAGATSTLTTVASAITSTAILPVNAARKDVKIFNNSTSRLYLAFGVTASVAGFTVLLEAGGFYEMAIAYTGAISGIWIAANGNALVTELT
ncbi:MAG: hypothetical protein LH702_01210 [Phormidesmis sp. CAN_BIN44]|nr:hypothetical protein [Phormidesmis sp. CAN_BIN44]